MAEVLFITPEELVKRTQLGGNVDPDRYITNIAFAQAFVIEPMLGSELYLKIQDDFQNGTLTGDYLELFDKYVKDITINEAAAQFIEVSNYMIESGGTFKHVADNREIVEKDEVLFLAGKYHNYAEALIGRFEKWICKHPLPEYKTCQDDVNAQEIKTSAGWYLGRNT